MEGKRPSIHTMSSTKPTLSGSIADLAPFVAAVLKDKTMMDLGKKLRECEEERLLVEITGPGGTPVHYQASLKNGEIRPSHPDLWNVCFEQKKNENGKDIVLPLNLIRNLEVRLGGIVVSDIKDLTDNADMDGGPTFSEYKEDPKFGNINFRYQDDSYQDDSISPIVEYASWSIGPVLYEDYLSLLDDDVGDISDFIDRGFPVNFNQTPVNLIITGVELNKEKIGSLLSIVERMGISTKRAVANHTN